jgi:hypothetical protein
MEDRQRAGATLCDDGVRIDPFAHNEQRISGVKLRGHGRSQRSGGKHRRIADTATRVDHRERKIFPQRRVLQAVVHDDQPGTLLARKGSAGNAVPRYDGRRGMRDHKRFVANLRGAVIVKVHTLWTGDVSPIAAAQAKRFHAGVRKHSCEHDDGWSLAGAA